MNSEDNLISDKERDEIASNVFDEIHKIYDFDYQKSYNLGDYSLPWTVCTTCFEKHRCVVSIVDMSAECAHCAFKRRVREEEDKLKKQKLDYRAEQLENFADIS